MEITELKKSDEKAWDEYVYKHPSSTFYHQIGWKNVVERTYGHKPIYLVAKQDGVIKGILPLFLMKSRLFGTKLISVPFAPYGGVCTVEKTIENALIDEATKITEIYSADYLELRCIEKHETELIANNRYVTFVLGLNRDPEIVWRGFNNKVRNATRKALKYNLEVVMSDNIDNFYNIYSKNMRDLGTPPHSNFFFKNMLHEFSKHVNIATVQYEGREITVMFLLYFKNTVISGWAASDKKYLRFNPNNLLYWEVIKSGCEEGYKNFDFGRSIINSGTFKFKKPWGAELRQLYYQYYLNAVNYIPNADQSNPKRQNFAKIWKKVPLPIANCVGLRIRKNFP